MAVVQVGVLVTHFTPRSDCPGLFMYLHIDAASVEGESVPMICKLAAEVVTRANPPCASCVPFTVETKRGM